MGAGLGARLGIKDVLKAYYATDWNNGQARKSNIKVSPLLMISTRDCARQIDTRIHEDKQVGQRKRISNKNNPENIKMDSKTDGNGKATIPSNGNSLLVATPTTIFPAEVPSLCPSMCRFLI